MTDSKDKDTYILNPKDETVFRAPLIGIYRLTLLGKTYEITGTEEEVEQKINKILRGEFE